MVQSSSEVVQDAGVVQMQRCRCSGAGAAVQGADAAVQGADAEVQLAVGSWQVQRRCRGSEAVLQRCCRGAAEVLRLWRCGADEVVSEEVVQRQRWCRGMGGAEAWVVQRWWWC